MQTATARRTSPIHAINFEWLVKLRWGIVLGQIVVALVAWLGMGVSLPWNVILGVLGFEITTNSLATIWWRNRPVVAEWENGALMAVDVLLLTVLLGFTGGPYNPFTSLYLVYVALAAVVLRPTWTWVLAGLGLASFGSLFLWSPTVEGSSHMHSHLRGMWVAFGLSAVFIVYFVQRVRRALAQRDEDLAAEKEKTARGAHLASLATLSAGAAHELSTPLSTIAVVAKELERKAIAVDELRLIRQEVERCRTILNQMAIDSGEMKGEALVSIEVHTFVEALLKGFFAPDRLQLLWENLDADRVVRVPQQATTRAVHGVFKNAVQASSESSPVQVRAECLEGELRLSVVDTGVGMTPEALAHAGEPFFTTKEPGEGMGLGLFLAHSVIEQLGGQVRLESKPGEGTRVDISIPLYEAEDLNHHG